MNARPTTNGEMNSGVYPIEFQGGVETKELRSMAVNRIVGIGKAGNQANSWCSAGIATSKQPIRKPNLKPVARLTSLSGSESTIGSSDNGKLRRCCCSE